jgi:hypothetical protein
MAISSQTNKINLKTREDRMKNQNTLGRSYTRIFLKNQWLEPQLVKKKKKKKEVNY